MDDMLDPHLVVGILVSSLLCIQDCYVHASAVITYCPPQVVDQSLYLTGRVAFVHRIIHVANIAFSRTLVNPDEKLKDGPQQSPSLFLELPSKVVPLASTSLRWSHSPASFKKRRLCSGDNPSQNLRTQLRLETSLSE